jgi:hypothetical protein
MRLLVAAERKLASRARGTRKFCIKTPIIEIGGSCVDQSFCQFSAADGSFGVDCAETKRNGDHRFFFWLIVVQTSSLLDRMVPHSPPTAKFESRLETFKLPNECSLNWNFGHDLMIL